MMPIICGIFTYLFFTYLLHLKSYNNDFKELSNHLFKDTLIDLIIFLIISTFIYFCINPFYYLFNIFIVIILIFNMTTIPYEVYSLLFVFSPDFYFSKASKSKLNQESLGFTPYYLLKEIYLTTWNKINISISVFFYLLSLFTYFYYPIKNINILLFISSFISYRVISRSFEIIYAFFKDITDLELKNPNLESNKRIKLATASYIEIIFNFATLNFLGAIIYRNFKFCLEYSEYFKYFFEFLENNTQKILFNFNNLNFSFITQIDIVENPLKILIKSFGITTFTNASVNSVLGILQILTTLVLVLFALAGYLNNKGDNK